MAIHRVGMAELKIGGPGDRLEALGLGSCIGLAIVDKVSHIGGMVHIMLPDSKIVQGPIKQLGKYADTAVPELLEQVIKAGAQRERLVVKMAGGAEMFAFAGSDSPKMAIGKRNAEAVQNHLREHRLKLSGSDTGGHKGRTFIVSLDDLNFMIRIVGMGESNL
ncbi:MAG: chemotaxis protein CheD [bacterium]|nr:chemotaxis protein CheD [bacterium]